VANIKSAKKRNIQNEKRRVKNSAVRSSVRTVTKKVLSSLESTSENKNQAVADQHMKFIKVVDKAAAKGIVHWKTAARKKSRMAKKVNALNSR
jgi:small subunit ribosomal protein S20